MTENEKLAEFFRKAPRSTIKVSPEAFDAFTDQLESPSKASPALILAMAKARAMRERQNENPD